MNDVCTYFDGIDNLRAIRFVNGQMLFCYTAPVRVFVEKIRMCAAGRCFESRVCSSPAWQAGLWHQTFWAQTAGEWSGQEKIAYKLQGDRTVRGGLCLLEA